jgi:hypothetical protein
MHIKIVKKGTTDLKRLSEVKWKLYAKKMEVIFLLLLVLE